MEMFFVLLPLCEGDTQATCSFPSQRDNTKLTSFICCKPEQADEETAQLPTTHIWSDNKKMWKKWRIYAFTVAS